jgi:hypothetical protein
VYALSLQNLYIYCTPGAAQKNVNYMSDSSYSPTSTIVVPPQFATRPGGSTIRVYSATFNGAGAPGFQVSAADGFEFEFDGQMLGQSTMIYAQSSAGPIQDSLFRVGSLMSTQFVPAPSSIGSTAVLFDLEADSYPVQNNVVLVREMNTGQYGFVAASPAGQSIEENYIQSIGVHNYTKIGTIFGTSVANNRFDIFTMFGNARSTLAIQSGGSGNYVFACNNGEATNDTSAGADTLVYVPDGLAWSANRTPYSFAGWPAWP